MMRVMGMMGPPWGLNPQFLLRIQMMMLPDPQYVPITAQGTQDKKDS